VVVLRGRTGPGKDVLNPTDQFRLLPVLAKILEKMLVSRIKWYVVPKLHPRQYGFMLQRSTEDALYILMQNVRTAIKGE
jgi:hypothetical protein